MISLNTERNRRILVIDDNRSIHNDFRKILCPSSKGDDFLAEAEALLFDSAPAAAARLSFEIDSAYHGQEGLDRVKQAVQEGRPYAMAFVDVRMPPGWDGVETAAQLWKICPDLQIVICSAYADYTWTGMADRLRNAHQMVILKKPFDAIEVLQLADSLTEKWHLHQQVKMKMEQLETVILQRTHDLQATNTRLEGEIQERKRTEAALRDSEERYQLLFQKNPLPMFVLDTETSSFLAVNEAAVREYGYTAGEFLSLHLKDVVLSESGASVPSDKEAAVARHRKKDQSVIDVEIASCPILISGRKAELILANDITGRKIAEARIREQAMLLDMAQDAIYVRDLAGGIKFWNNAAERLYGWTTAEAVGANLAQLFPDDAKKLLNEAEQLLLAKGEWRGELSQKAKGGQEVISDSRWTLLTDHDGKPLSVLVINTDQTERKKLEAQFLRAQRMESIGTLASGMAHDLNNILAPILMSASVLRWKLPATDQEVIIKRIETSVKRAAEIIQQVLTFGRGVRGQRVAVDPAELLLEVGKIVGETFPKNITIRIDASSHLGPILGDRTQIHQVLLNLCINARDAMPEGGFLTLRAENHRVSEEFAAANVPSQPGAYVLLKVTDTGCGIALPDRDKVFDPFFTTKDIGKGTGLGLSTVMGIVKSHHGFINVDSELAKGTTFRVYLPASSDATVKSVETPKPVLPRGRGETILLVDDEGAILEATGKTLEQFGYRVLSASDGATALEIFQRAEPEVDLVLTDIMMSGMDGVALVRAIRKIDSTVRVIASTGLGVKLVPEELELLTANLLLSKPYDAETLLATLQQALKGAVKRGARDLVSEVAG
jgi:two-component system cell cycle sensor histidine kinase/response regulator CckA